MTIAAAEKVPFYLNPKVRAVFFQIGVLCMVGLLPGISYPTP